MDTNRKEGEKIDIADADNFFKQVSSIFSDIDNKILLLHNCSSDDFASFNSRLKQYHDLVMKINSNSVNILETIDSDKTSDYYTKLNFFHYKIKKYVEHFEVKTEEQIRQLEISSSIINSMLLPLKNYKQNLITLKYLIANLKLNMLYINFSSNLEQEEDIKKVDDAIKCVLDLLPIFEKGLEELKENIFLTLLSLKQFRDRSSLNSFMILHQTDYSLNLLNAKHSTIVNQVVALRQKTAVCSENVSNIVVNLQFHDIIRQKIEHVQTTNKKVFDDLILKEDGNENIGIKASKIKDVAELQIAQLLHTNQKYQLAIETIVKQFSDITDNLTSVVPIYENIEDQFNFSFNDTEEELLSGVKIVNSLTNAIDDFSVKTTNIKESLSSLKQLESKLHQNNNILNDIANNFISNYKNGKLENEFSKLSTYLKNAQSFHKHQYALQDAFAKICNVGEDFYVVENDDNKNSNFKDELININDKVTELVGNIKCNNKLITSNLGDTYTLSTDVVKDIKYSIEQVKYYDYFERIMENEILSNLNILYNEISKQINLISDYDKSEFLSRFESLYTMQSERTIHKSVNGMGGFDADNIDNNDNEVEFF